MTKLDERHHLNLVISDFYHSFGKFVLWSRIDWAHDMLSLTLQKNHIHAYFKLWTHGILIISSYVSNIVMDNKKAAFLIKMGKFWLQYNCKFNLWNVFLGAKCLIRGCCGLIKRYVKIIKEVWKSKHRAGFCYACLKHKIKTEIKKITPLICPS